MGEQGTALQESDRSTMYLKQEILCIRCIGSQFDALAEHECHVSCCLEPEMRLTGSGRLQRALHGLSEHSYSASMTPPASGLSSVQAHVHHSVPFVDHYQ